MSLVTLKFPEGQTTQSLGRNGPMKTIGISALHYSNDIISICPVNSKGLVGRCSIEIPKGTLLKLATQIKKSSSNMTFFSIPNLKRPR